MRALFAATAKRQLAKIKKKKKKNEKERGKTRVLVRAAFTCAR
jgi:hypothetical protein